MEEKSISRTVNLLKGIVCVTAVIYHSLILISPYTPEKYGVLRFIVESLVSPSLLIFILITGYYSFEIDEKKVKKRIISLVKLLFLCIAFYTIFRLIYTFYRTGSLDIVKFINDHFTLEAVLSTIKYCEFSLWIPGWYLVAMIETYLFYYVFIKVKKTWILMKLTYILIIIGTAFYIYSNTYLLRLGQNAFFVRALPNFLLGIKIREKMDNNSLNMKNINLMLCVVLGWIIDILPLVWKLPINTVIIGDAIVGPALFVLAIKNSEKIHNYIFENIGSKYFMMIYVYHICVLNLLPGILRRLGIYMDGITLVFFPLLSVLLTLLVSVVLFRIKSKFKKVII